MMRFLFAAALCAGALLLPTSVASAQAQGIDRRPTGSVVRFGRNVRIGGHDFSNQTFSARRRGRIYLYQGRPRNEGCRQVRDGRGGRTKVCHLQRRR